MNGRTLFPLVFVTTFVWLLCIEDAHAYIDPGTGSMILQALLAGAVAILAFGKQIYRFIAGKFAGSGEKPPESLSGTEADDEDKG